MNYDRALERIRRIAAAIGIAGVLITLIWRGPRMATGFLAGTILSMINLRWWTGLANALGPSGKAPRRSKPPGPGGGTPPSRGSVPKIPLVKV